jgi:hypothetical protein
MLALPDNLDFPALCDFSADILYNGYHLDWSMRHAGYPVVRAGTLAQINVSSRLCFIK